MNKSDLRKMGKQILSAYHQEERDGIQRSLHNQLFDSCLWNDARTIGVTVSREPEWSTKSIIETAWRQEKNVVVPKCIPKSKQMQFYAFTSYHQLETVYFGLQEPNPTITIPIHKHKIDLLVVPGLLFDNRGYRIGYGGGFYDRFLEDFNGSTVMLASNRQYCANLPVDQYDIPVEYISTENGLHKTGLS